VFDKPVEAHCHKRDRYGQEICKVMRDAKPGRRGSGGCGCPVDRPRRAARSSQRPSGVGIAGRGQIANVSDRPNNRRSRSASPLRGSFRLTS
jgi:hypothetical protein